MGARNEHGLTPKQELFAIEVVRGQSLSDAYRAAYKTRMTPKQVHEEASKLMSHPKVHQRVAALQTAAADRAELDTAEIIREIRRLAVSDIAGIMHLDGRVKLPHELEPATRAAIASFKIDEYGRIEYKFWDKGAALEKAARIKGLYEADNSQKGKGAAEFLKGLQGSVLGVTSQPVEDDDDD